MSDTEEESASSESWPVNEDWLIDMLKQHHKTSNDIKITDFSVKQGCQDGVSNLSDILAVYVVYAIANEREQYEKLDFIIKLLPHDPFSRYFVTEAKFDLREIKFYTKVGISYKFFYLQKHSNKIYSLEISDSSRSLGVPRLSSQEWMR